MKRNKADKNAYNKTISNWRQH